MMFAQRQSCSRRVAARLGVTLPHELDAAVAHLDALRAERSDAPDPRSSPPGS